MQISEYFQIQSIYGAENVCTGVIGYGENDGANEKKFRAPIDPPRGAEMQISEYFTIQSIFVADNWNEYVIGHGENDEIIFFDM